MKKNALDIWARKAYIGMMDCCKLKLGNWKFYHGSMPLAENALWKLKGKGINVIWNLTAEFKGILYREEKIFEHVLNTPIKDYDIPDAETFSQDLKKIIEFLNEGYCLFIHCMAGHGRTGMAVAALAKCNGMSTEEALLFAYNNCKGPETEKQIKFIQNLTIFE